MSNQIKQLSKLSKLEQIKEEVDNLTKALLALNQESKALLQDCLSNNTDFNTIRDKVERLIKERDELEETKRLLKIKFDELDNEI